MLEALPWPKHLKNVPEYAGGHHERMDGKGYPRGLTRDQMSVQARVMGIADIFEALTAQGPALQEGQDAHRVAAHPRQVQAERPHRSGSVRRLRARARLPAIRGAVPRPRTDRRGRRDARSRATRGTDGKRQEMPTGPAGFFPCRTRPAENRPANLPTLVGIVRATREKCRPIMVCAPSEQRPAAGNPSLYQSVARHWTVWHTACIFAGRTSPVCVPHVQPP